MALTPYSTEREKEKAKKDLYYSKQADLLKKNYGTSVSELDANVKRAKEDAAISHEMLKKYLPTTMRAMGVENSGTADSLSLQALSNYQNNLADISGNYNSQKAALDMKHNEQLSELERYKSDDYDAIDAKYDAKAEDASNTSYSEISTHIEQAIGEYLADGREDGKLSPTEYSNLETYLNESPNLTDTDRATLENYLKGYKRYVRSPDEQDTLDEERQTIDAATKTKDLIKIEGDLNTANDNKGDNFKVTYNNNKYNVQKGNDVTDPTLAATLTEVYGATPAKGASVIYNGKIYMFLENNNEGEDRWCEIEDRPFGVPSDNNSYDALLSALSLPNKYDRK